MQEIEITVNRDSNRKGKNINNIIFYHKNCADGLCSAALVELYTKIRYNKKSNIDNIGSIANIYIPISYGDEEYVVNNIVDIIKKRLNSYYEDYSFPVRYNNFDNLYVVDFSFSAEQLLKITGELNNPYVYCIDHHKTAKNKIEEFCNIYDNCISVFDEEKESGASLTYRTFDKEIDYKTDDIDQEYIINWPSANKIVNICKDYDLWLHKIDITMNFITGVMFNDTYKTVENWVKILTNSNLINFYTGIGNAVIEQQKDTAESLYNAKNEIHYITINNEKVAIINIPHSWANIVSDTLFKMDKSIHAVMSYHINGIKDKVTISMRGNSYVDDNNIDCSYITSEYFNGGGHRNSAGGCSDDFGSFKRTIEDINRDNN